MLLDPIRQVRRLYDRAENKVQRIRMGPAPVAEYQGKLKKALGLWEERAATDRYDVEARVAIVRVLRLMGKDHEAYEELAKLTTEIGKPTEVLREIAEAAEAAEDWVGAVDAWVEVRSADPTNAEWTVRLADAMRRCQRFAKAEALYDEVASCGEVREEALIGLAITAKERGDPAEALRQWTCVEDEFGRTVESIVGSANAHLRLCQVDVASQVLHGGLEQYPNAYRIHQLICQIAQATCDFATWEEHLSVLIQLRPKSTYVRTQRALAANNLGNVFLYWRDLDFATDRYRRDAWNGSPEGLADLVTVLLRKGEWEQAQALLPPLVDECLRRPTGPIIKAAVNALIWVGDLPGLNFLADTIDPELCAPRALVELANLMVIVERNDVAVDLIERIANIHSRRAVELKAWAVARSGDTDSARSLIMDASYPHTMHHFRSLDGEPLGDLQPVRVTVSPEDLRETVVAMSVCRDEIDRLPEWFEHYRAMGVEHFIIVDNGSTDGTIDFLMDQPDVQLFSAEGHYRPTASGRRWLNQLMAEWCDGAWCLIADADEFLVFPEMDRGISSLTAYLDSTGAETMFALMLDMYGENLTTWTDRSSGSTMADLFPLFDARTYLIGSRTAPYFNVSAGMRNLVLSRVMPESLLSKPVLIKGGRGIVHLTSHTTTPCRGADVSGVFLHYKFAVDPKPRSTFASSKGVFARLLASDLATTRDLKLRTEHSVRYSDPAQLVAHGLMRTSRGFAAFD